MSLTLETMFPATKPPMVRAFIESEEGSISGRAIGCALTQSARDKINNIS